VLNLLRFVVRLAMVLPLIIFALLCVCLLYPWLPMDARVRLWLNRTWSRCLLGACGVKLSVRGRPRLDGAVLWVANHVSWIDIFVVNAVRATSFVAKAEIRSWPLVGWLAMGAGTLFIDRNQRHAVHDMGQAIHNCFQRGDAVGLFPEGTTTEGFGLRPFHASLFEPARQAGVPIQPVAQRFLHHGQRSGFAAFVGEETLVANLWRVLGAGGLAVELVFLPELPATGADGEPLNRLELSRQAREAIASQL